MAPTIHCVRHAQGYHNLSFANHSMLDPLLTTYGHKQCVELNSTFPVPQISINLIVASPLRRTLHTAVLSFGEALKSSTCIPQIIALPEAQETSDYPCDTGSNVTNLKNYCDEQDWPVDLSLVPEDWTDKRLGGKWGPTSTAISARAHQARLYIRSKIQELVASGIESPNVVLISHGGYMHYFTEDWEDSNKYMGTGWANVETRAYNLEEDGIADSNASLVETAESRERRGKDTPWRGRSTSLFQAGMVGWEAQGLQNPNTMDVGPEAPAVGVQVKAKA